MSDAMNDLLRRVQFLERQIGSAPNRVSWDRNQLSGVAMTGSGAVGIVRLSGSTWVQATAATITPTSVIGYALPTSSAAKRIFTEGAVWVDHAFTVGSPLYCDPSDSSLTTTKPTVDGDSQRIIAYAGASGWIWLANSGEVQPGMLTRLADVDIDPGDLEEDDVISWDATAEKWVRNTVAAIGLGERLATSVIGRSANSAGVAADIQAEANQRFFGRQSDALGFFQVAWADLNLTGAALAMGGDISGNSDNATVVGIQGEPVAATTPVLRDVLIYTDANEWEPQQILSVRGALLTVADDGTGERLGSLGPGAAGTFLESRGTGENLIWSNGPLRIGDYSVDTQYTGSGTHNFAADKTDFVIMMCGGGGGGGSTSGSSGSSGLTAGGGGGAGAVVIIFGKITVASMAYSVGGGGAAGSGTGGGSDGGDSTITINGDTITAPGGVGGAGSSNLGNGGSGGIPSTAEIDKYAQSNDAIAVPIGGGAGQPGRLSSVSFDGLGAVTGLVAAAGVGGANVLANYGGGSRGTGGTGGFHSGVAPTAGAAGTIIVFEI